MYGEAVTEIFTNETLIKDIVQLGKDSGEFIHVETSKEKLARTFGKMARENGLNEKESERFFLENVDVKLGSTKKAILEDSDTFDRKIMTHVSQFMGTAGAVVLPKENNKIDLVIDTQEIGKAISIAGELYLNVKNFNELPTEIKTATFNHLLDSITEHEFVHIIQNIKDRKRMIDAKQTAINTNRMLMGYLALAVPAVVGGPASMVAYAAGTLPLVGGIAYLNKRGMVEIEKEAYTLQKESIRNNKRLNAFSCEAEKTKKI